MPRNDFGRGTFEEGSIIPGFFFSITMLRSRVLQRFLTFSVGSETCPYPRAYGLLRGRCSLNRTSFFFRPVFLLKLERVLADIRCTKASSFTPLYVSRRSCCCCCCCVKRVSARCFGGSASSPCCWRTCHGTHFCLYRYL